MDMNESDLIANILLALITWTILSIVFGTL